MRSGSCLPFGPTTSVTSSSISSLRTPSPTPTLSASNPSFAAPASSPSATCTRSGSTAASVPAGTDATSSTSTFCTAVPPVSDGLQAPSTLSTGADGAGGPPSQVLRATGQPRGQVDLAIGDTALGEQALGQAAVDAVVVAVDRHSSHGLSFQ